MNGGMSCTILEQPAGDNVVADAAELMHGGEAADHDMVADDHVAGEGAVVGENAVVADDAVVRDVAVGEEDAVAADHGSVAGRGGAVHGDKLAEDVVFPDPQPGGFAAVFQILRSLADRGISSRIRCAVRMSLGPSRVTWLWTTQPSPRRTPARITA
jgi:hypothetical protein